MDPWSATRKLHHTRNVAVTPAPVRFPTQRPLVPSFTEARHIYILTLLSRGLGVLLSTRTTDARSIPGDEGFFSSVWDRCQSNVVANLDS